MAFFGKMKIKTILTIMISISLVTMFLFGFLLIKDKYDHYRNHKKVSDILSFSVKLSELIHQIQKERGVSALYLGSEGEKFQKRLTEQRALTDKKIDIINSEDYSALKKSYFGEYKRVLETLSSLPLRREEITGQKISVIESIKFYSSLNDRIIEMLNAMVLSQEKIAKTLVSYLDFINAKEKSGILRAIGSSVFAKGSFDRDTKLHFEKLAFAEGEFIKEFLHASAQNTRQSYINTVKKSDSYEKVEKYKKEALETDINQPLDIDPKEWFDAMTAKINNMQKVEKEISEEIIYTAQKGAKDEFYNFIIFILFVFASVFAVLFMSLYVKKRFFSSIDHLRKGVEDLLSYLNAKVTVPSYIEIKNSNEISEISQMMNDYMKQQFHKNRCDLFTIGETVLVMDKITKGYFDTFVTNIPSSAGMKTLANALNKMVKNQSRILKDVDTLLKRLSKDDYSSKIKVDDHIQGNLRDIVLSLNSLVDILRENAVNNLENGTNLKKRVEVFSETSTHLIETAREQTDAIKNTSEAVNVMYRQVEEVVSHSEKITGQSEDIHSILTTISEIADQTNLLALNAAIEAARAGEHGKGFAVVADEVRLLAEKTQKSLSNISLTVNSLSQSALEIDTSIKEQSVSIRKIHKTVSSLENSARKNAKTSQVIYDSSQEIAHISESLVRAAENKKIENV